MNVTEDTKVWKVSRAFKAIGSGTTPRSGEEKYFEGGDINWLITGDLNDGEVTETSKKITPLALADYSTLKTYPAQSLVIAMYGATIAKLGLLKIPTTVNQACCVLVPSKRVNPKYAFYYFLSSKQKLIDLGSGGGQPNISQDTIRSFKITLPPSEKQVEMVNYLDEKTSTVDKMITVKNHTHTHLSELRQAIISDALFGQSGGDTMRVQLRRITTLQTTKQSAISEVPIITLENVGSWSGKLLGYTNHEDVSGDLVAYKKGDVLFNKLRPYLAKVHVANEDGLCTGEMLVLRPHKEKIDSRYLFYFLVSQKTISDVDVATYGVKMPRANWDFVGSLEIDLPSLENQRKIVAELDAKIAKVEAADSKLQKSIGQLEEYRSSLISNVVGGKVTI